MTRYRNNDLVGGQSYTLYASSCTSALNCDHVFRDVALLVGSRQRDGLFEITKSGFQSLMWLRAIPDTQ